VERFFFAHYGAATEFKNTPPNVKTWTPFPERLLSFFFGITPFRRRPIYSRGVDIGRTPNFFCDLTIFLEVFYPPGGTI
jgi:hypothetical protein